ncbi:hypothetical protein JCM5350_003777 [Sporobolomyces pararoseus]
MLRLARARVRLKVPSPTTTTVRTFSFRPSSPNPQPLDWPPPLSPSPTFPSSEHALFFGGHALKLLPEQEERDFLAAYHHERLEFVGDRLWGEVVSQVVFLLAPATGSNLQTLHEKTTRLCTNEMATRLANSVKLEITRGVTLDNDDAADRFEAYLAATFFANGRRALLSFLVPLVQREFFSKFNVVPVLEMSTTATSYGPRDQPSQRSNLPLRYQSQEQLDAHVIHDLIRLSSRLTKFSFTHLWQLEIPGFPPISAKGPAARGPRVYRDLVKQCCFAKLIIVEDQESFNTNNFVKKVAFARNTTSSSRSTSEDSAPQLSKSPPAKTPSLPLPTTSSLSLEEEAGILVRQNEDVLESPTSVSTSIATVPKETPLDDWETVKSRSGGWVFKSKTDMLRLFHPSNLATALQSPSRLHYSITCGIDEQALTAEGNTRTEAIENLFFAAVKSETLPNSNEGREKLNHRLSQFHKEDEICCTLKLGNNDHLVQVARPMNMKPMKLWKDFAKECVAQGIVRYPASERRQVECYDNSKAASSAISSAPLSPLQHESLDSLGSSKSLDSLKSLDSFDPLTSSSQHLIVPSADISLPQLDSNSCKEEVSNAKPRPIETSPPILVTSDVVFPMSRPVYRLSKQRKLGLVLSQLTEIEPTSIRLETTIRAPGFDEVTITSNSMSGAVLTINEIMRERRAYTIDSTIPRQILTLPFNLTSGGDQFLHCFSVMARTEPACKLTVKYTLQLPGWEAFEVSNENIWSQYPFADLVRIAVERGAIVWSDEPEESSSTSSHPSVKSKTADTSPSDEEFTTETHLLSIPSTSSPESSLDGNPSSVHERTEDDSASSELETAPREPTSSLDSVSAPTSLSSLSVSSTALIASREAEETSSEMFHETERSERASSYAPASTMTSAMEDLSDNATASPPSSELSLKVARSPEEELTTALAELEESVTLADISTSDPLHDDPPSTSNQSPNSHHSELSKGGSSTLPSDELSTTSVSRISTTEVSREVQPRLKEEESDMVEEEEDEPEARSNFPPMSDLEWMPVPSSADTTIPAHSKSNNDTYQTLPPINISSSQHFLEKVKALGGKFSSKPEQAETLPFNLMNPNHDILHRLGKFCQRNPDNKLTWKWTLSIPGYPAVILNDDGLGMKRLRSRILFVEAVKAGIFSLPDRTVHHNSSPSPSPTTTKSSTVPAEQSKKPTSFLDSLAEEASHPKDDESLSSDRKALD